LTKIRVISALHHHHDTNVPQQQWFAFVAVPILYAVVKEQISKRSEDRYDHSP